MRCISAIAVFALSLSAAAAQPEGLRFDGTFIQYHRNMADMTIKEWREEMDAIGRAKMRTIILQRLGDQAGMYFTAEGMRPDPTEVILDYADHQGMEVYVGLLDDPEWAAKALDRVYIEDLTKRSGAFAEEVWKRYGKHASFAGWYIPQEISFWGLNDEQAVTLRNYLAWVGAKCKGLSGGKPVSIAPYWDPKASPDTVRADLRRVIPDEGVDIVMLQDGVGARGWEDDVERVIPYFQAAREACLQGGVALWADTECFRLVEPTEGSEEKPKFAPATAARLARQLAAEAPYVDRFVTFDFYHYMSPRRGEEQEALFGAYEKLILGTAFYPTEGHSTTVSIGFPYYGQRSPESIASELRANGFSTVHFIFPTPELIDPKLIEACHRERIGVWYGAFANTSYSVDELPEDWETWEIIRRGDLSGEEYDRSAIQFCLNRPEFRKWKQEQIVAVLKKHPFDGLDVMEPYWPDWPGPKSPRYGCFCDACATTFRSMFGEGLSLPDVVDSDAPDSPQKNPELWRQWLLFRQNSVTAFLNLLVNGKGGVRASAPGVKVCAWSLGLMDDPDGSKVREVNGCDIAALAQTVKPDMLCIQTHWPDWMKKDLAPDYVKAYQPFVDAAHASGPAIPVMIQADAGSRKDNRRGWDWIGSFRKTCDDMGVRSSTYYEYFISGYMYSDAPRVAFVRSQPGGVQLHFTKRLAHKSATDLANYKVEGIDIKEAKLDGNIVTLLGEGLVPGKRYVLTASGISDAPGLRLVPEEPSRVMVSQQIRFVAQAQ